MPIQGSDIFRLFDLVIEKSASDLHITVGRPPVVRLQGHLKNINHPALTPPETLTLIEEIAPAGKLKELHELGGCDFGYAYGTKARFRVACMRAKGSFGMVCRLIPSRLLTFEQIGLPQRVVELLDRPRGLLLVTGPTGSGKTTTLATMVNYLNDNDDGHIITIEDPIEYFHDHKKSIVTQREVGSDVPKFSEAMRRSLRQDPDTILLGEMRDLETIATAITAAETGHLVFGTLHTSSAAKTIDRIVDVFPAAEKEMVRAMLSESLRAVISQTLLKRIGGGRIAAHEIMIGTPAIRNLIREGKIAQMYSAIQTGQAAGMQTLDQCLKELLQKGLITKEEARFRAQNKEEF